MLSSERPKNAPAFSAYRPSMDITKRGTRRGIFLGGELTVVSDPIKKIPQRRATLPQPLRPNKAMDKKKSQAFWRLAFFRV